MPTRITLAVNDRHVTIPYPPVTEGEDAHEGFVSLKGKEIEVPAISAAQESQALQQALIRINASSTPFFTVASRAELNHDHSGYWARGYLEFALNYEEVAKDSPNYFLIFEQFTSHARNVKLDLPVDFNFDLHPATFAEADADGYTACVWITTAQFPDEDTPIKAWNQSIGFLSEFLGSYEKLDIPAIYPD